MPNQTTNYNLVKPLGAENYNVEDQNGNMDIIDGALKGLQDNKEALIKNATAKTTLVDADTLPLSDSAASSGTKKITFANIKAALKTYFDTQYNNYVHPTTAGNKHVPTGGAASQILKYSASGTAVWADNIAIVNGLAETEAGKALDATQGKALSDIISTKLTRFVGTTAGTATALTAAIPGATLADFTNIQVRLHADIGDGATLNLNSLGEKPIYTNLGEAVTAGAITGSMLNLMYNATLGRWYLLDVMLGTSVPDGATVTPVDDYSIWLACAGLTDTYGSLANVISSVVARGVLCNNLNALRYMARSLAIIFSAVQANADWITSLDTCPYSFHVPTMTSDTAPNGVVSWSWGTQYGSNYKWQAFDKNATSQCIPTDYGGNGWLQYQFDAAVTCSLFYKMTLTSVADSSALKTFSISVSEDGSSFNEILASNTITQGFSGSKNLNPGYGGNRIRLNRTANYGSTLPFGVKEIDFFGLDLS